jgi:hypothetical protein
MKQTIKQPIWLYALFISVAIFSFTFDSHGQTVKVDASGNYVAVKSVKSDSASYKSTGRTYTDTKGNSYPVMISSRGKLFVIRTSKTTGNPYRQYLKL